MSMDIEKYIKAIRQLKRSKSANNISKEIVNEKELMPLTNVMSMIDELNNIIAKHENKEIEPIRNYLDHMKNDRGVRFSEKKFDYLFFDNYQLSETNDDGVIEENRKGKKLNYSYFNKLSGFVAPYGKLKWDDNEITEFFKNLK